RPHRGRAVERRLGLHHRRLREPPGGHRPKLPRPVPHPLTGPAPAGPVRAVGLRPAPLRWSTGTAAGRRGAPVALRTGERPRGPRRQDAGITAARPRGVPPCSPAPPADGPAERDGRVRGTAG